MPLEKKKKKIKKQIRLLDDKELKIKLEKRILEFSEIYNTEDKIILKSKEIINKLEDEDNFMDRINLEMDLEALSYIIENFEGDKYNDEDLYYPEIGDPNFSSKISMKKEFTQFKINNQEWNIDKLSDISKKCSWKELSQTQKFLQNYISQLTPYNGILLFHGVGVGKTCSSITIAEEFKNLLEEKKKKIYVLLKPSIRENFKKSIIDINKINNGDDEQCTSDSYFEEIGINYLGKHFTKKDDLKKLERRINKIINKYYNFFGYGEFISIFKDIEDSIKEKDSKQRKIILQNKIRDKFSDSVIIIDEAHNITPRDGSYDIKVNPLKSDSLKNNKQHNRQNRQNKKLKTKKIIKKCSNNEKKSLKRGECEEVKQEGGSYNDLRENLELTNSEKDGKEVSEILMKIIKIAKNIKLVLLSATPMYNEASEIIYLLNLLLANDNRPLLNKKDLFLNGKLTEKGKNILKKKVPGYVSYLRSENPINYPYKLESIGNDILESKDFPKLDMKNNRIPEDKQSKFLKLVRCDMTGFQLEVYEKYFDSEEMNVRSFDTVGSQICNIVFNEDLNLKKEEIENVNNYYSDRGFSQILKKEGKKYTFKKDLFKNYFSLKNLEKVAPKIKKIVENINNSNGINFVYSQFKNSGVFPLAFCLEMEGYTNFNGDTLLNLPKDYKKKIMNGKIAKYLIITGESSEEFNKYKREKENLNEDGSELKVILGTQAAGEGLNIFNVRGIHILDPWHHLNRLEQIIGRGLRSCSHKNLPLKLRNLSVFLYAVTYPDNMKETLDIKMYRKSEEKTKNVFEVQRELKKLAVDCHLNKEGNVYLDKKWRDEIDVIDLFGNKRKITLEDKKNSKICDYMEICDYKCYSDKKYVDIDLSTYTLDFSKHDIKTTIKIIKNYFKKTNLVNSNFNDIFSYISNIKNDISVDILGRTLFNMIHKETDVYDRFNRKGYIIYRGNNYIFQPKNMADTISIIERKLLPKRRTRKIGMDALLKKITLKKNLQSKIKVKLGNDILFDFIKDVNTYFLKLTEEFNNNNLQIIIEIIYDKLNFSDKFNVLTDILRKIEYKEESINIQNNVNHLNIIDTILKDFKIEEKDENILKLLLEYIITKKIFNIDNILGFKICKKNEIKYYKNNNELLEDKEIIEIQLKYVSKLKNEKFNNRILSNLYGFIQEDKKGNINFKIFDKNDRAVKTTQQRKGSTCNHFKIQDLNNFLKRIDISKKIKGKNNLCDSINFRLRQMEKENKDNKIYFFALDEFLELNKN